MSLVPRMRYPARDARVSLNPDVKDRYGIPVAHLSGSAHPETVRTAAFMHERAKEWLWASGAIKVWGQAPPRYLSGGQHQAGACRMGEDPANSVVDPFCRVHSHDQSLHRRWLAACDEWRFQSGGDHYGAGLAHGREDRERLVTLWPGRSVL